MSLAQWETFKKEFPFAQHRCIDVLDASRCDVNRWSLNRCQLQVIDYVVESEHGRRHANRPVNKLKDHRLVKNDFEDADWGNVSRRFRTCGFRPA